MKEKIIKTEPEKENRNSVPILTHGIGTRIGKVAKMLGGNAAAGRASFKSDIQIGRYIREESTPGIDVIVALAKASGVSLQWLATGEGPMLINEMHHAKDEALGEEYAMLPLYDVRAAAGHGAVVEHEQVIDWLAFKKEWLHRELHANVSDLYLIEVDGESMEPTLRPGDIILIDRRDASTLPRDGIYVLRMDGTLLVKRLQRLPGGQVRVSSDNEAYQPFILELEKMEDQTAIIGRVVWAGRRM